MKKIITFLFISISCFSYSQSPQLINYQGAARDQNGAPLVNKKLGVKFEIVQGTASPTLVFSETQTVTTNVLGLFFTQIGQNTSLNSVNWLTGPHFMEVSVDTSGGTNFIPTGKQQIASVPFALSAPAPPVSFSANVLSVGNNTVSIAAATITGTNGVVVSQGPNYTISASPSTLVLNNNSLSIAGGANTITLPGTSVNMVGTGMAVVSPTNGSSFSVNVPAPAYSPNTGVLSFGTSTAQVVPALTLNNGILSSGPFTNSVSVPQGVSVSGAGIANVSGAPNYTVNVPAPVLTLSNNTLSINNGNSVVLPQSFPQGTLTGGGIAIVTSLGTNSFNVSVPMPTYNTTSGLLTFGASSNTALVVPTFSFSGSTLFVGPTSNSVNIANGFPWKQGLNSVTLTTGADRVGIGANAATPSAKLDVQGESTLTVQVIKAVNTNAANTGAAIDASSNGALGLLVSNTSNTGVGGNFTSLGGYALFAQNSSSTVPAFYANNTSTVPNAYAGYFVGGFVAQGKNANSTDFAFRAQNNASSDLFVVRNDGKIGIGTNTPSQKLDVVGSMRIADGFEGSGKVLVSDVNGVTAWRSSPSPVVYGSLNNSAVTVSSTATPLGTPTMTFTKVYTNTEVMVSLYSRIFSGNFAGASIVFFEIYVDGVAAAAGPVHPLLNTSTSGYVSISSIFTGLSVGPHTVTIVGRTDSGTSTSVIVDSGGLGGKIIIKEMF